MLSQKSGSKWVLLFFSHCINFRFGCMQSLKAESFAVMNDTAIPVLYACKALSNGGIRRFKYPLPHSPAFLIYAISWSISSQCFMMNQHGRGVPFVLYAEATNGQVCWAVNFLLSAVSTPDSFNPTAYKSTKTRLGVSLTGSQKCECLHLEYHY